MTETNTIPTWPAPALDRLAVRVMERAIADAASAARKGDANSRPHVWLWDKGRPMADAIGGEPFLRVIVSVCEELEIMAYHAQAGEGYTPQHPLLSKRRRKVNAPL